MQGVVCPRPQRLETSEPLLQHRQRRQRPRRPQRRFQELNLSLLALGLGLGLAVNLVQTLLHPGAALCFLALFSRPRGRDLALVHGLETSARSLARRHPKDARFPRASRGKGRRGGPKGGRRRRRRASAAASLLACCSLFSGAGPELEGAGTQAVFRTRGCRARGCRSSVITEKKLKLCF